MRFKNENYIIESECNKMKNLRKAITLVIVSAMGAMLLAGCASKPATEAAASASPSTKKIKIAIVQPMSHSSLDQIRDTIVSELKASGRDIEIDTQNANGDSSALATIFQKEKSDGADIIVPIATGAAQSAKSAFEGSDTPIIFASVSDPVAAGMTGSDCKNITGVSNKIPSDEIIKLITNFQPNYKKIGFLYTASETNSVSAIKSAKKYCDDNGIAYEEATIAAASDIQAAVNTLASKGVDALYTGNDNTIAAAMPTYIDAAYSKNIPVYCGADSMVADGGFATTGINYVTLGKQVAAMILKVADGTAPTEIPYETMNEYAKYVNLQAADHLGLKLTDTMLTGYTVLVEKDGTSHFGK